MNHGITGMLISRAMLVCIFMSMTFLSRAVLAQQVCDPCTAWQSIVDPDARANKNPAPDKKSTPTRRSSIDISDKSVELNQEGIFEAIECLLKLEGKTKDALLSGATRPDTSQTFGSASVEVAALYYISYLYYQKWGHAGAIALVDKQRKINRSAAITQAYAAYKKWFKKLREIGFEKARELGLDPLDGTDVHWYQ